jgi:regulator of PEP synthase PpsR (kinase-PPPase family)
MHRKNLPIVFVVSDSLGETAEFVARAAASQFDHGQVEIRRIPYVDDEAHLEEMMEEAKKYNSVIIYTVVKEKLRNELLRLADENGIPCVDILGPSMKAIEKASGQKPRMETGLLRKMDEDYFKMVEEIEFAVKYDDGKDARGLRTADIVLVGVSRTSKTPLSMYLAHKSLKVANIPLVPEVAPPEELFKISNKKIIALTINPELLNGIRSERLKSLGLTPNADYASLERILAELDYAESIVKRLKCPIINVTNRAVEETAGKILEIYYKGERHVN